MIINLNEHPVGCRLLAKTGKKKKSRIVEILVFEWSASGFFRAEIRDGLKIKLGWFSVSSYFVVDVLSNPFDTIRGELQSKIEEASNYLNENAEKRIQMILNRFPEEMHEEVRARILELMTIDELNKENDYLVVSLQEDMLDLYAKAWSKTMPKHDNSLSMGVPVGYLTGMPVGGVPDFLNIAKPVEDSVKEPEEHGGGQAFSDIFMKPQQNNESKFTYVSKDHVNPNDLMVSDSGAGYKSVTLTHEQLSELSNFPKASEHAFFTKHPNGEITTSIEQFLKAREALSKKDSELPSDGQPKLVSREIDTEFGKMMVHEVEMPVVEQGTIGSGGLDGLPLDVVDRDNENIDND